MGGKQSKQEVQATPNTNATASMSKYPTSDTENSKPISADELRLQQIENMPKLAKTETFEEKLYRKFSEQPLVPIGCLTTAYFLGSGINSFYNRDAVRSQKMMRLRVGSQFATIMIFVGYAGMNAFNMQFRPNHELKKKQQSE